jgi:hypothetical protein
MTTPTSKTPLFCEDNNHSIKYSQLRAYYYEVINFVGNIIEVGG